MSIAVKASGGDQESVNARRERAWVWTLVLVLGAIVAGALATLFYVDAAPLIEFPPVGP